MSAVARENAAVTPHTGPAAVVAASGVSGPADAYRGEAATPRGSARAKVSAAQVAAAVAALRTGKTSLRQQSAALGFKGNNELRAALRAALGRAEYDALIAQARAARAAARSTGAAT